MLFFSTYLSGRHLSMSVITLTKYERSLPTLLLLSQSIVASHNFNALHDTTNFHQTNYCHSTYRLSVSTNHHLSCFTNTHPLEIFHAHFHNNFLFLHASNRAEPSYPAQYLITPSPFRLQLVLKTHKDLPSDATVNWKDLGFHRRLKSQEVSTCRKCQHC